LTRRCEAHGEERSVTLLKGIAELLYPEKYERMEEEA
jgi:hypothetical protein